MMKSFVFFSMLVLFVSACSNEGSIGEINGNKISNETFDAYLKFKRINITDENQRNNIIKQYLEREALAQVAADSGVLDTDLMQAELNDFRQQMHISRYFEKYLKEAVSDQAIQNYYVANAKNYEQKKVHVAHILFRTSREMGDNERAAKMTTAHEVYSKLKSGEDFKKLATEYSEDKNSASKGGDLDWVNEGAIHSLFSEKAFSLKVNEFTEPFETPFGYHIVQLLESEKVVKRPFESVKGTIRYELRQKAKDAEINRLNNNIEIEIY